MKILNPILPIMDTILGDLTKHSPLFLDGDEVTLPYDKPMFEWLQAAGFHPQKAERRLSQALRANSAQGHGHSHDHHGYHHHGDGNWHQH